MVLYIHMFVLKRKNYILLAVLLLLIVIGLLLYFFRGSFLNPQTKNYSKNEAESLYNKVGNHFVLPEGELPTIATVTDPEKLKGQAFFIKAKAGDKVLIFTNAKEAILYDPVIDKVVTVAPLNIDENNIKESSGVSNTLNNF